MIFDTVPQPRVIRQAKESKQLAHDKCKLSRGQDKRDARGRNESYRKRAGSSSEQGLADRHPATRLPPGTMGKLHRNVGG